MFGLKKAYECSYYVKKYMCFPDKMEKIINDQGTNTYQPKL
jgi:hypothetical protein